DLRLLFFVLSSRRRHTRFARDWSPDVCSSDLSTWPTPTRASAAAGRAAASATATPPAARCATAPPWRGSAPWPSRQPGPTYGSRSEERRVGKEGELKALRRCANE